MVSVEDLTYAPRMLGSVFYPGGFPVRTDQFNVGGKSVQELFLLKCQQKATKDQEDVLKQYLFYFISAPVFDNELTNELKAKISMEDDLDDLIMECVGCALDPF